MFLEIKELLSWPSVLITMTTALLELVDFKVFKIRENVKLLRGAIHSFGLSPRSYFTPLERS